MESELIPNFGETLPEEVPAELKVLIAGMGNMLRGDDGFGVAMAERLMSRPSWSQIAPPDDGRPGFRNNLRVTIREFGIGGVHLVQELLSGYDALLLLDAVEMGATPGSLHLLEPQVPDLHDLTPAARRDFLADMHWATPDRALILAGELGVLPRRLLILGCQPESLDGLSLVLSASVEKTLAAATDLVAAALDRWR